MPSQIIDLNQAQRPPKTLSVERIWRTALDLLSAELPRATFDTWVRDAEPLAFDGHTYTIGVANEYARDWLVDRLLEPSRRILSQIVGQAVDVQFVLSDEASDLTNLGSTNLEQLHEKTSLTPNSDTVDTDVDQRLDVLFQFRRYWDAIVDSEKVISISRYFVNYWLPILGPTFSSIVLAFKQLRYLHRSNSHEPMEVSAQEILQWLRVDYSTFYRNMNKPHPLLPWFIEQTPSVGPKFKKSEDGKLRRKLRKYIVYAGVPLSPPHQIAVEILLSGLGAGADVDKTIDALEAATKLPQSELDEMLDMTFSEYLVNGDASHPVKAQTVLDIVRKILGNGHKDLPIERLAELSEKLENQIVRPDRAILLSWYFVRDWHSLLSDAAFWFIILLRSRGFYDKRSSELRDTFWIDGGYAELSDLLGVSSETISGWLGQNRKKTSTKLSEHMRLFVNELERTRGRNNHDRRRLSIKLKVEMLDPLTPTGEELLREMAREDRIDLGKLEPYLINYPEKSKLGESDYPELSNVGIANYPENRGVEEHDTPENRNLRNNDYPENYNVDGRYSTENRNVLNDSLITIPDDMTQKIQKTLENTTTADVGVNQLILPFIYKSNSGGDAENATGKKGGWSLENLVRRNSVPPGMVRELRRVEADPTHFAAWILYAYSKEGKGIEKPGIFAAKCMLEDSPILPGEKWVQLAETGPEFVKSNLEHAMVSLLDETDEVWRWAMKGTSIARLKDLSHALGFDMGGKIDIYRTRVDKGAQ